MVWSLTKEAKTTHQTDHIRHLCRWKQHWSLWRVAVRDRASPEHSVEKHLTWSEKHLFFGGVFVEVSFWQGGKNVRKNSKPNRSCVLGSTSPRNPCALPSCSTLDCASGTMHMQHAWVSLFGRTSHAASIYNIASFTVYNRRDFLLKTSTESSVTWRWHRYLLFIHTAEQIQHLRRHATPHFEPLLFIWKGKVVKVHSP